VEVWDGTSLKIIDHKTTSEDIEQKPDKPILPYWRQLVVEAQPTHYMLLKWLNGQKVDGAIWDVVKKPGIQPAQIRAKKDVTDILTTGRYYDQELTPASLEALRNEPRETLEMYEARLAYDCTTERPGHYFQRRDVPRLDSEIHDWAKELWGHSQDLLYARRDNRWPKNSKACMAFKRPCVYLGVCSGFDSPDSDKWTRKAQVHNELPITDGDGRDVLTNSRIGCKMTCPRKHLYQYELGIERVDDEEAEALYFGTIWHLGQDAWWSYGISKEENGNDNTGDTAPLFGAVVNDTADAAQPDFY
jgi:hypothetical protein